MLIIISITIVFKVNKTVGIKKLFSEKSDFLLQWNMLRKLQLIPIC